MEEDGDNAFLPGDAFVLTGLAALPGVIYIKQEDGTWLYYDFGDDSDCDAAEVDEDELDNLAIAGLAKIIRHPYPGKHERTTMGKHGIIKLGNVEIPGELLRPDRWGEGFEYFEFKIDGASEYNAIRKADGLEFIPDQEPFPPGFAFFYSGAPRVTYVKQDNEKWRYYDTLAYNSGIAAINERLLSVDTKNGNAFVVHDPGADD